MGHLKSGFSVSLALVWGAAQCAEPIKVHPANPHYLMFRGKPTLLISSAEHYGAVINLDFDYDIYLKELGSKSMNQTRVFSGAFREVPGSFGISDNTLAPAPNRYLSPWARSATPGFAHGGNKFDLTKYDPEYFARLKDFLAKAGAQGVVVEYVFFVNWYLDDMWNVSPMKASNNINGIGGIARGLVNTLENGNLMAVQEAFVRKVVQELKDVDNVYYEICNEPGAADAWQKRIAEVIHDEEKNFAFRHLIAQNLHEDKMTINSPHLSILNYHYAGPDLARANYGKNLVMSLDETGFDGSADFPYRYQAWEFLLAGGGIYSNLDYSFTTAKEDGTATQSAPGGGGVNLRKQLQALRRFLESMDFVRMTPNKTLVAGGLPSTVSHECLAEPGMQYAFYFRGGTRISPELKLPAGDYVAEWMNTKTGEGHGKESFKHGTGNKTLTSPAYTEDIALKILSEASTALSAVRPFRTSRSVGSIPREAGRTVSEVDFLGRWLRVGSGTKRPWDKAIINQSRPAETILP